MSGRQHSGRISTRNLWVASGSLEFSAFCLGKRDCGMWREPGRPLGRRRKLRGRQRRRTRAGADHPPLLRQARSNSTGVLLTACYTARNRLGREMKVLCFTLIGVLALSGSSHAQETQVLAQNAQIKVELTRFPENCSDLMAREVPKAPSTPSTCVEMAITNNSPPSITA